MPGVYTAEFLLGSQQPAAWVQSGAGTAMRAPESCFSAGDCMPQSLCCHLCDPHGAAPQNPMVGEQLCSFRACWCCHQGLDVTLGTTAMGHPLWVCMATLLPRTLGIWPHGTGRSAALGLWFPNALEHLMGVNLCNQERTLCVVPCFPRSQPSPSQVEDACTGIENNAVPAVW